MRMRRREKGKQKRRKERGNNESFGRMCASHPSASLFELFAFWDVLLCLLHIFMGVQHISFDVVHQFTLKKKTRDAVIAVVVRDINN